MTLATIADHHRAYAQGQTNPVEIAERFLASQPVGGPINPFISVNPEQVLTEAAESAKRLADDQAAGPLEGVLVGIKDFFSVRGHVSRGGTGFLVAPGDRDAAIVTRLRAAGAIIAGKTRTTELGLSPLGVTPATGSPRNPHDPRRVTGGSSSGSAAAVAGGFTPIAVGTDGGGSVRIPPAMCGVFGFKPTFGRVSSDGAMNVGWWTLDHPGPIARCVTDIVRTFQVLAGLPDVELQDAEGIRVGVDWQNWQVPDSAIDEACRDAITGLAPAAVRIEHSDLARITEYITVAAEVATAMYDHIREDPSRFGLDVQSLLQTALEMTAVDYLRAQQVRTVLDREYQTVFEQVDVLVSPTTACTAFELPPEAWDEGLLDEPLLQRVTAYSFPANLLGLPSITVPVGTDPDGMPIGLMLTAARGHDDVVLRLAAALEGRGVAAVPRPNAWIDALGRSAVQESDA